MWILTHKKTQTLMICFLAKNMMKSLLTALKAILNYIQNYLLMKYD